MAGIGIENKKRRAFIFPNDELEALVVAVEERKSHLFGKFSQPLTSRIKYKRWHEVSDAVSVVCGVLRTVESIKKNWLTVANDAKTRMALQKRDQAKTGAGMPEVKPITTLEEKIRAILGQVYTQGKFNSTLAYIAS